MRSLSSGFAAAGTRSQHVASHAVLWLSHDGAQWQTVPVPSQRRPEGSDVLSWDGRRVVTATGPGDAADQQGDPEVWILENPEATLAGG